MQNQALDLVIILERYCMIFSNICQKHKLTKCKMHLFSNDHFITKGNCTLILIMSSQY